MRFLCSPGSVLHTFHPDIANISLLVYWKWAILTLCLYQVGRTSYCVESNFVLGLPPEDGGFAQW